MKTLIVHYLPRGERSHTAKLLQAYQEVLPPGELVEELDLTVDVPDLFLPGRLDAYVLRHYLHHELTPEQVASLAVMDKMTAQFKEADIVVMAFPMHNFSMPAIVKAYFDSVMQKGETWDANESGYVGKMNGRKALALMASGGIYEGPMASWEHALRLAEVEFTFMGFSDIRSVTAPGMNMTPEKVPDIVAEAQVKVRAIANEWYSLVTQ